MAGVPDRPSGHRPAFWAVAVVRLAAAVLPVGVIRDRYRQEFLADLAGMTGREQAGYSVLVLLHAIPLRVAVRIGYRRPLTKGHDMVIRTRKPLLCRLNIRHHWATESTSDGTRFAHCSRCGKDATGPLPISDDTAAQARKAAGLGGTGMGLGG